MTELFQINQTELLNYLYQQKKSNYIRNVDGAFEPVDYSTGSLRFWINDEARSYENHWHPAVEIVSILEGSYSVSVDSEVYALSAGDILMIPGGSLHCLSAPESGLRLIYLAEFSRFSDLSGFNYLNALFTRPILINDETVPDIAAEERAYIIEMLREYYSQDVFKEMEIFSILLRFTVNYLRHRPKNNDSDLAEGAIHANHRSLRDHIMPVLDYIDKHYAEEITLEKGAEIAGFSKYHFSRMFKDCTGYNFSDYLCMHRTKVAAELLSGSVISVTDVAILTGFSSLSTFNRIFKKQKGYTPSQYRRMFSAS